MLVRSWYPGLDPSVLTKMRAGSDTDVDAAWPAICHRAAEIRRSINPLEYTPYLDAEGNPMEMPAFSDLVYSMSSSSEAGAGPGDTGASPDGAYHTTSSSDEYAMSDANAEGSASSGQAQGQADVRRTDDAGTSQPGPVEEPPAPQAEPKTTAATSATPPEASMPASGEGAVPPGPSA